MAMHLPYGTRWGPIGKLSGNPKKYLCRILFKKTDNKFSVGKNIDFNVTGHLITLGERANIGNHAWIMGEGEADSWTRHYDGGYILTNQSLGQSTHSSMTLLSWAHEARWAHTQSRDVREDTSHGGAARQRR